MDAAHRATDEELLRIEKRLTEIYNQAAQELQEKADKYFERFKVLDAQKRTLVDAGKMSEADYKKWRQGKIMTGKHWTEMSRQAAQRLTDADKTAAEYVNGRLPYVYSLNYNKVSEALETRLAGYSFEMVSEETVRHLAIADRTLLPARRVDVAKDMRWNMQMFQAETLQGILQGESMDKIAKRIFPEIMKKADKKGKTEAEMKGVTKRARDAAIRNARTMVTGAENKGRMDMLHDAQKKGVIAHKIWIAAHDSRTRHWHSELDGVEKGMDEPFENVIIASKIKSYPDKIMYPGDPDAAPANTYNCRCSLGYKVVGFGKGGGD